MRKQKNKKDILVIQKYKGARIGVLSMLFTLIIAIICYVLVLVALQYGEFNGNIEIFFGVSKDVLLAIISIIGTSFLTSMFIEKNKKNIDYTELVANDIFASPEFFSNLTEENRKKMLISLEDDMYRRDNIRGELFQKCRDEINENQYDFYYEELNVTITYQKHATFSEKKFTRILRIRSYEEIIKLDKLFIMSYELNPAKGMNNFDLLSASITEKNKELEIGKDIIVDEEPVRDPLSYKCGYTDRYAVYLLKDAVLEPNKDLVITLKYVSRVTVEDNSMCVRTVVPCRKFNFNFIAPEGYSLYAHSFGFLNRENNFPNSDFKNSMQIQFSKWLLPGEGVSISVMEENSEASEAESEVAVVKGKI